MLVSIDRESVGGAIGCGTALRPWTVPFALLGHSFPEIRCETPFDANFKASRQVISPLYEHPIQ